MKFYIKRLGCPKNDVDGDYIAGKLIEAGHMVVETDEEAEAVIVNTCGFITPAKQESINEILYYEKLKEDGNIQYLYVTGCLSQRYSDELKNEINGVDGFFGLGQIENIVGQFSINRTDLPLISITPPKENRYIASDIRFVDRRFPFEYLKIAEGCDRYCSYCSIPLIRGRFRSRPIDQIITEAKMLVEYGKKELILVSQEGTAYGRDLGNRVGPIDLLHKLEKINGIEWIRLMYLHPESVTDDLIEYMTTSEKVLGYFDMPLQHINDKILTSMRRKVTRDKIERIIDKIRTASDQNILRTTFITGLPGEGDDEFDELHNFVEEIRFDRLGVFQYSPEEGTRAFNMDNQVPEDIARERQDLLMSLQQEIAFEKNIALIDKIQKVIIDEIDEDGRAIGRSWGDCPDIDQTVIIENGQLAVGDIVDAKIISADGYDLIGTVGE